MFMVSSVLTLNVGEKLAFFCDEIQSRRNGALFRTSAGKVDGFRRRAAREAIAVPTRSLTVIPVFCRCAVQYATALILNPIWVLTQIAQEVKSNL